MSLEEKRINLYQKFRQRAIDGGILDEFDKKYPTFDKWKLANFANESSVVALWDKSLKATKANPNPILSATTKEIFFQTFACDLNIFKYSNYCIQEGFPKCASVKGTVQTESFGFGKKFIKYRTTVSRDWLGDKPEIKLYASSGGDTGEFIVVSGPKTNTRGTYTCNGFQLVLNEPAGATTTTTTPTTTTTTPTTTTTTTPPPTTPPVKAVVIQKGDYNLKVAGSDAIIY